MASASSLQVTACRRVACLAALTFATPVQADWLVELADCGDMGGAGLALVYPGAVPAVAAAGDRVVLRVRLPLALTPPPGIQQPRALVGWGARLEARGYDLQTGAPAPFGYELEVTDVRPDAASTLVYRATVLLPGWLAPGSYDLVLSTPGGRVALARSVRVLETGASPRLSLLDRADLHQPALESAPVDVFMVADALVDTPVAAPAAPWTAPSAAAARVAIGGGRVLRLGRCARGAAPPVSDAAATVDARQLVAELGAPPPGHYRSLDAAATVPLVASTVAPLPSGGLRVEPAPAARELLVLAPGTRAVRVTAGRLSWYPARGLARLAVADGVMPLVGRWTLPANAEGRIVLEAAAPASSALSIPPRRALPGEPVALSLLGADGVRVAWLADHGGMVHTAFGPSVTRHAFTALGRHAVRAVALSADGRSDTALGWVEVEAPTPAGCGVHTGAPGGPGCGALWVATFLLKRRRRPRAGNRLARGFG